MSNTAKRKQLIARTERMTKGFEVTINPDHYMRDLIMALNYYNSNHDDKDKKKWFITHYAKIDKKLAVELLKVDEQHFRTAGVLARMIEGGSVLQENELRHLTEKTEALLAQIQKRQKSQDVQDKKDAAAAKATADAATAKAASDATAAKATADAATAKAASDKALADALAKATADAATAKAAADKAAVDAKAAADAAKLASDTALAAKDAQIAKLVADNAASVKAFKKSFNTLASKWNKKNPSAKVALIP